MAQKIQLLNIAMLSNRIFFFFSFFSSQIFGNGDKCFFFFFYFSFVVTKMVKKILPNIAIKKI